MHGVTGIAILWAIEGTNVCVIFCTHDWNVLHDIQNTPGHLLWIGKALYLNSAHVGEM